jgi:hypothetical protein
VRPQLFFANATLCPDLASKNPRSCDVLEKMLASQGALRVPPAYGRRLRQC